MMQIKNKFWMAPTEVQSCSAVIIEERLYFIAR